MVKSNHPDFNKTFYLQTDTRDEELGAELFQEGEDGEWRMLPFASRGLSTAERNYMTTEKELLSIVFTTKKFRTYQLGNRVVTGQTIEHWLF